MKITRRQLRKIIREEKAKLTEGITNYSRDAGFQSSREELLSLATYADRAAVAFEEQFAPLESITFDSGPDGLARQIDDIAYRLQILARNARNKAKDA